MYNKQDVNATPYNPKTTTWLLTAQRTDVGLHSPEIFWIKKHVNTITHFFFHFMKWPVLKIFKGIFFIILGLHLFLERIPSEESKREETPIFFQQ